MGILTEYNAFYKYADNRDVISLFSGAMGLDIGMQKAGLNIVIGQDSDESCIKLCKLMVTMYWAEIFVE